MSLKDWLKEINMNMVWTLGLISSVVTVLGSETFIQDRYHHWITLVGVITTAVSGYMIQHPWNGRNRRK